MGKYSADTVAKWFIMRNQRAMDDQGGEALTLLKLEKLLYYAEGCHLAFFNGEQLFDENFYAWEHGPVVKEVYQVYQENPYNLPLTDNDLKQALSIDTENQNLLEQVFQTFGQYSAWALRNKTHEERPWLEATDNGRHLGGLISRKTMLDYFKENYIA